MLNLILLQITQTTDSISGTAGSTGDKSLTFIELLFKGGVIMVPIIILSMISVYIIVERYLYIKKASKIDSNFFNNIRSLIFKGDFDAAKMLCRGTDSPLARMVEVGINRIGKPVKEIEGAIENIGRVEMMKMERNMGILGVIAGIAPMLGFIGTILGVIKIFYNISLADNISIGLIAGGLYEKMITSCAGLIVGVISYAGYHLLSLIIEKFSLRMEITLVEFMDLLHAPTK